MHSARIDKSDRLQRVHDLLEGGREYSTLEISIQAEVCAVNSIVSELRDQGAVIECRQIHGRSNGNRLWLYRMTQAAPDRHPQKESG